MEKRSILVTTDQAGGIIHACPYCHRYVKREKGIKICLCCYGAVDNEMKCMRGYYEQVTRPHNIVHRMKDGRLKIKYPDGHESFMDCFDSI